MGVGATSGGSRTMYVVEIAAGGQTVYEGATNRPQGHVQALSINTNGSPEVWGWGVNMSWETERAAEASRMFRCKQSGDKRLQT